MATNDPWEDFDFEAEFGPDFDYLGPDGQPKTDPTWADLQALGRRVRYLETRPRGTLEVTYLGEDHSVTHIDLFPLLPRQDCIAARALQDANYTPLEELADTLIREKYQTPEDSPW